MAGATSFRRTRTSRPELTGMRGKLLAALLFQQSDVVEDAPFDESGDGKPRRVKYRASQSLQHGDRQLHGAARGAGTSHREAAGLRAGAIAKRGISHAGAYRHRIRRTVHPRPRRFVGKEARREVSPSYPSAPAGTSAFDEMKWRLPSTTPRAHRRIIIDDESTL